MTEARLQLLTQQLTDRQLQVVLARLNGNTYRNIALTLNLDEATIRGHWQRAIRRLSPHIPIQELTA